MKKSEAAKYARWSAALALVCAGLTVGVYLKRGWTRHVERKNAPPAAPVDVERQSSLLTFSKVEQNQKIFTIEASKSIDFKGLNTSDLEGVKITIFGKEGNRHDTMETHTCRYTKDSGDIRCSGEVEIVLMSADEWNARHGAVARTQRAPGTMRVETRGVAFNRASGQAKTDQQVRFSFLNGSGEAVGAEYHSEEGTLSLQKDVRLRLDQPAAASKKSTATNAPEPVEITGTRMDLSRGAGTIYLEGPAEAKTKTDRLTAAAIVLELDENLHAKRLIAKSSGEGKRTEFTSVKFIGKQRLAADEITAAFAPEGWVVRADAAGQVSGAFERGEQIQTVQAERASMEMAPGENAPKLVMLKGGVDVQTKAWTGTAGRREAPETRRLTTEDLRLAFQGKGKTTGTKLVSAATPGTGRLEWNIPGDAKSKASRTEMQANRLDMRFDAKGNASRLDATGDVRTERNVTGSEKQAATAKNATVELQPQGGWSRMQLNEEVRLNEGSRSAQADHGEFTRADQKVTLMGHATVKDATSLTSARTLTMWQATGEMRGEGGVRFSDLSARGGTVHMAPVPANISAEAMNGNSKTGRVIYTGHARLWQGDSVMEADSIELLRPERRLNATGNVRAVFPQAPASAKPAAALRTSKQPILWHARAANMSYWDQEDRARLEQGVTIESELQRMKSDILELYFTRDAMRATKGKNGGGTQGTSAVIPEALGAQQISRAVATGGVTVQQGERRATAEQGEYIAADGKFVMSGGKPTIFDSTEGTTTGRQLTFFLADATIVVDSENGPRTLTKHRVEK
jgi:lipopolysaccharide export system protein LptA